jgi:putative transposase
MKRYDQPQMLVTDQLRSCGAAMQQIGNAEQEETGSTIEPKIQTSHLNDQGGQCCTLGRCEPCKNSLPAMPQSTTISTRSVTFTADQTSS